MQSSMFSCHSITFMISWFASSLIVLFVVRWCFVMLLKVHWECMKPRRPCQLGWAGEKVVPLQLLEWPCYLALHEVTPADSVLHHSKLPNCLWHVTQVHKVCHSLAEQIYWYPLNQFRVGVVIYHTLHLPMVLYNHGSLVSFLSLSGCLHYFLLNTRQSTS